MRIRRPQREWESAPERPEHRGALAEARRDRHAPLVRRAPHRCADQLLGRPHEPARQRDGAKLGLEEDPQALGAIRVVGQHVREAGVVGERPRQGVAQRLGVVGQRTADLAGGCSSMRREVGRGL
jgi:hypothetical protein